MTNLLGTGIFWTTVVVAVATLSYATLVGRSLALLLPMRLRGVARFYLSPALGLACLVILASLLGRFLPLGDSAYVPAAVFAMGLLALARERDVAQACRQALAVGAFGLVAGTSVLVPLYVYGALDAHNDAFTYLAQMDWLQEHAFRERITADAVTSLTSQVFLYQQGGFRMGGTYLSALVQGMLNLRWSYQVLPGVLIAALGSACLAIGFPIAGALRRLDRRLRYVLLALPAFTVGGLAFGISRGFMPQTVGLALGPAFLFLAGAWFRWLCAGERRVSALLISSIPVAVSLAAAVFVYTEFAPFLLAAALAAAFVQGVRTGAWRSLAIALAALGLLVALVLNAELLRAYTALRIQSGVVVGGAVDWSLAGFIAHALGVHGGLWGLFQWTAPGADTRSLVAGYLLLAAMLGVLVLGSRPIWRTVKHGELLPSAALLLLFGAALVWFRYFVASPFPVGLGQSWNQFKLVEWAHPFTAALLLLALVAARRKLGKAFNGALMVLFGIGLVVAASVSLATVKPLSDYYAGTRNLDRFYLDFRHAVTSACPPQAPVFLAMDNSHDKFKHLAALYLPDRDVLSDWTGDEFVRHYLSADRVSATLVPGSCVVEAVNASKWLGPDAITTGPFRVGSFHPRPGIAIVSQSGGYSREGDNRNWWHWVEKSIDFKLMTVDIAATASATRLHFDYLPLGRQGLRVQVRARNGATQSVELPPGSASPFDATVALPAASVVGVLVETDGQAATLSATDTRKAAFKISNLSVEPVSP